MRPLLVLIAAAILIVPGSARAQQGMLPRGCTGRDGVPTDSLRALARRLYPESVSKENALNSMTVGLVFDRTCKLVRRGIVRRPKDAMTVGEVFAIMFPDSAGRSLTEAAFEISGIAAAGDGRVSAGGPQIVWGILRSQGTGR